MPAAVWPSRGQGTFVALGFPSAALLALALWSGLHGMSLDTSVPAAIVLVAMTAVAETISVVVAPRARISAAAPFLVAAALAGGPLVGALAGASTEAFTGGDVWRPRSTYAGSRALKGFVVGLIGEQLTLRGVSGALTAAAAGVVAGTVLTTAANVVVAFDRKIDLRPQLRASWRATVLTSILPMPLLAVFLFEFWAAPTLPLARAVGLLLLLALGNRFRLRLERSLAEERSRARLDALTNAPNRYALEEALAAEEARIRRGGRPAALCFLDLDRFKAVNDTHGYRAGDKLLVDVYRRLRDELRASDQVFRWGGEEFVVLAPQVESQDLMEFAERLRMFIASRPFSVEGHPRTVTGSVGAVLLDETKSAEAALDGASRLVREAKRTRDSVAVDAPLTGTGGEALAATASGS